MTGNLIALNAPLFWTTFFVAALCLNPLTNSPVRKWVLACINLGFLLPLLRWHLISVIGVVLVAQLLLREIRRPVLGSFALGLLAAGTLCLFILHKGIPAPAGLNLSNLLNVLSIIGFSFLALRMVEVVRAIAEGRYPAPDFPTLVNYLLPFHMLAAGPIQSYDDFISHAGKQQPMSSRDVLAGAERIARGLFKKFVIAFMLKEMFLTNFQSSGMYLWFEMQIFFIWLYFDFSAYSDIAIGVGKLIGVATPENFNNPLLARNVIDFWDRWHISLSLFIRRNLFIPIQLSLTRQSKVARPLTYAALATFVSFELCGLWHGFSVSWLIWGALHGLGLVAVRAYTEFLLRLLGPKGLKSYRESRIVRGVSTVMTFEYLAFSFFPLFYFHSALFY